MYSALARKYLAVHTAQSLYKILMQTNRTYTVHMHGKLKANHIEVLKRGHTELEHNSSKLYLKLRSPFKGEPLQYSYVTCTLKLILDHAFRTQPTLPQSTDHALIFYVHIRPINYHSNLQIIS